MLGTNSMSDDVWASDGEEATHRVKTLDLIYKSVSLIQWVQTAYGRVTMKA